MVKILVAYYSRSGHTKKMAEAIALGVKQAGAVGTLRDVARIKPADLLEYDGIILGSPTYYGTLAAPVKKLLDDSVRFHGKLDGKVGAAFTSSANIGGGNETTLLSILEAFLIHGMIIWGDWKGDHYGPVAVPHTDPRVRRECLRLGARVAELAGKVCK